MGTPKTRGFTIIETLLFLAISGLLVVTMIAGTGASISIQRYRDAVETFKTTLQNQYDDLLSVQNDRDNTWTCTAQAATQPDGAEVRGQSACLLLGRYVSVVGSDITTYNVLGRAASNPSGTSDIEKLKNGYQLNISTVLDDKSTLEWGTRIAWAKKGDDSRTPMPVAARSIALLFVRSPDSGQIYTFSSDNPPLVPTPQTLAAMLVSGNTIPGQKARAICIDSGGLFVPAGSSIYINSFATGSNSIETRSNTYTKSIGGNTEC